MSMRATLAKASLWINIVLAATFLGGSIYETLVINLIWSASMPESLSFITNQQYSVNPGRFWPAFSPWYEISLLSAVILNWPVPRRRTWMLLSAGCYLALVVSTVFYFLPVLRILYSPDGAGYSGAELSAMGRNWMIGTYGRIALRLIILAASVQALSIRFTAREKLSKAANDAV
jgi:hypothetical protein